MKVLIVEDESAAYENLSTMLTQVSPDIEVVGNTESVSQTAKWLLQHPLPDLIFMDIHLSDGLAFSLFEQVAVEAPIIFTTAYDKYAIEAFKVNSIDYLLKPIKEAELRRALAKYRKWSHPEWMQLLEQIGQMNQTINPQQHYNPRLLIPYKDKLLPIELDNVACFYTADKNTSIYLRDGRSYAYAKTLDQIMSTLDPTKFIRANKQFILSRQSIQNLTIWFDSRLLVTLDVETPERIYVSKNKAAEFKNWIVS